MAAAPLSCRAIASSLGLGAKRCAEMRSGGKPPTHGNSVAVGAPPQSKPMLQWLRWLSVLLSRLSGKAFRRDGDLVRARVRAS